MYYKTMLTTTLFTPKSINLYRRLGIRYINKNKLILIKKSFEIMNEDLTNEILSYFKYNHITDDTLNSYLYIFIYELFYISVMIKFNPNNKQKIINQSTLHLLIYLFVKRTLFHE
jgi:hypothetical protein